MTAWITRITPADAVEGPLRGLTFAIEDNIDLAGVPTTAADPRRVEPARENAVVVDRLISAGAVACGKTNLDQYATGLVGTRSPYGACHSVFSVDHVSGGSSSGSAVVVAGGEVDFALATDTAGSGRVPAAFNGIVGMKPTRGLISTRGVLPACRSLDCVSVMARDVSTARRVLEVAAEFDAEDPFARRVALTAPRARVPVIGVPVGDLALEPMHELAWMEVMAGADRLGTVVPVDVTALLEPADLLHGGPWLAERWHAFGDRLGEDPAVDPVVRSVVGRGATVTGAEVFAGLEELARLARRAEEVWSRVDALLLPVTALHPTLAEVAADPVGVDSRLGRFTTMTNLLDLCAVAVPGPVRADGLPFGIQLLAPAGADLVLLDLAETWCDPEAGTGGRSAAADGQPQREVLIAVAGAHLSGQPLNADLRGRGARFGFLARTAPDYRMFVVPGEMPRPGLTRTVSPAGEQEAGGQVTGGQVTGDAGIEVEVWRLPVSELAGFMATIAPPLAIGPLQLSDSSTVLGFVCTADGVDPDREITAFGGWRAYLSERAGLSAR